MSARGRLVVAFVSTALMAYVAVGSLLGHVWGDNSYGQLTLFNEVIRLVIDAYVEPVNLDRAMAGADLGLTDALDGDSAYLDADDFKAYQQSGPDADIGVLLTRRFAFLYVIATRPGSPAEKAGIKGGDVIKTIDGRHTRPISAPLGEKLLKGAPGSVVKLKVLRDGNDPVDFSIVRERLAFAAPTHSVLQDGVGYLKIPEFGPKTAEEVRSDLDGLRRSGARRLVLDLRAASYGSAADAAKVAELFLKGGVVAKLVSRRSPEQVLNADPARNAWSLPMTVLVDTRTAGPGEIVAAALLDAGRSSVVGRHTFGRAPIQKPVPLSEGGLVLTVAKYVSPKGTPIHGKGVEPTVDVQNADRWGGDVTATEDPILQKALEVLNKDEAQKAA
jgi:carboxyl-terminal processing protease